MTPTMGGLSSDAALWKTLSALVLCISYANTIPQVHASSNRASCAQR
jgi:hypothetical protein